MGFVDLFRPKWKHSKASVRAEALRRLPADQHTVLVDAARNDRDEHVRRVAVERLEDPEALLEVARGDASKIGALAEARAVALYVERAVTARDLDVARRALDALSDPKQLARVVDRARDDGVRSLALQRVDDPRVLAELARDATDPAVRRQVVQAISDSTILRSLAIGPEPRDTAIAAIERLEDPEALAQVIKKTPRKNLRNRAKRRLAVVAPPPVEPEPAGPTPEQLHYAAQVKLLAVVESAMVGKAYDDPGAVADATEQWAALPSHDGELAGRFDHAVKQFELDRERDRVRRQQEEQARAEAAERELLAATRRAREAANRADETADAPAPKPARSPAPPEEPAPTAEAIAAQAQANATRLEEACAELEAAATTTELRPAQALLKRTAAMFAEPTPLPSPELGEQLHARYEHARAALHTVVQTLAENDKWREWANLTKQRTLAEEAQTLAATATTLCRRSGAAAQGQATAGRVEVGAERPGRQG
ncbi:MAG: hypothetical protein AAF721_15820 [Myxococcota bacterium]